MKVVYDSQIFSVQKYGGVSRYFCEIASRISKQSDVQVSITAPLYINTYLQSVPQDIVFGFKSPYARRFRILSGVTNKFISGAMLYLKRPDIIHETYFSLCRSGPRNTKRVITIHDMIHEKFPKSFPSTDKTSKYKALAAKRADHIICVSESTKKDAVEILGLPPEKISVIYHGFDLMNYNSEPKTLHPSPIDSPFLLYVGNRGGYKNFARLLEVYQKSKILNTGYKILCLGGGDFNENEYKVMSDLSIDRNKIIQLEGNDELLSTCYKNATAFIYPSLYEGFGIPPLEAMAHNCPVVCSNTSSIPEVVNNAGEYFDPFNIESMITAIEKVVMSENHKKQLIIKGQARLKYFSWDKCANETLGVYKKLL